MLLTFTISHTNNTTNDTEAESISGVDSQLMLEVNCDPHLHISSSDIYLLYL